MRRVAVSVLAVRPTGRRSVTGFATRLDGSCGVETFEVDLYPESPRGAAFRDRRVALGLTLGQVARTLGVSPADLAGVEAGRKTFGDWDEPARELESAARIQRLEGDRPARVYRAKGER